MNTEWDYSYGTVIVLNKFYRIAPKMDVVDKSAKGAAGKLVSIGEKVTLMIKLQEFDCILKVEYSGVSILIKLSDLIIQNAELSESIVFVKYRMSVQNPTKNSKSVSRT